MPKAKANPRAPRGLDRTAVLEAGYALFDAEGETGFSIRKLGARIGVDPMTVLHHVGSKEALLRSIADRALASIEAPEPSGRWQDDLLAVATAYRRLAHRHPHMFHLHFRYHATGPADHASSEIVYAALRSAGLDSAEAAGLGLAFYSFVLGFAQSEIEGLLKPLEGTEAEELAALDPDAYPVTRALVPAFRALDPDRAFQDAIGAFILGIEARCSCQTKSTPRDVAKERRTGSGASRIA